MKTYYLGGMCGMGMAPLALLLKNDKTRVVGFDNCPNEEVVSMLKSQNIEFLQDFDKTQICDDFIISTALLNRDFSGKKFKQRGQAFAEFCDDKKLICIVGSHGKTSVSNMCAYLINSLNLEGIGYMLGALPNGDYLPAKNCENGDYILAEIDESDATIENFSPEICCALNFDLDHTNTYATKADMLSMFERLFARTKGKILVPKNSKELCALAENSGKDFLVIDTDNTDFDSFNKSMASSLMSVVCDKNIELKSLENFSGTKRRQEVILDNENLFVIADYAHHPSEIKEFFKWLNLRYQEKKIIFFQPHRYTRTKQFYNDFKEVLLEQSKQNSEIYLLPVYAASEPFDPSASSELIAKNSPFKLIEFKDLGDVIKEELKATNAKIHLSFVGAGDIYFKAKNTLKEMENF